MTPDLYMDYRVSSGCVIWKINWKRKKEREREKEVCVCVCVFISTSPSLISFVNSTGRRV